MPVIANADRWLAVLPVIANADRWLAVLPVIANADRWLAVLPVSQVPAHRNHWQDLQAREIYSHFFSLLARVAADPRLVAPGYRTLREDLSRRVWGLIEGAVKDEQLATLMYEHRYEISRGVDGWLVSLNDLELKFKIIELQAIGDDSHTAPLLNCFRARSRLASITNIVLMADPEQAPALAGTRILAHRIALAQSLDLPLAFEQRLDRTLGAPSQQSIDRMRDRIIEDESFLEWPTLLVEEEFWMLFLKRKHQARFQVALSHYNQSLERALDSVNNEGMAEGSYLVLAQRLNDQRRADERRLALELTATEWAAFTHA